MKSILIVFTIIIIGVIIFFFAPLRTVYFTCGIANCDNSSAKVSIFEYMRNYK